MEFRDFNLLVVDGKAPFWGRHNKNNSEAEGAKTIEISFSLEFKPIRRCNRLCEPTLKGKPRDKDEFIESLKTSIYSQT